VISNNEGKPTLMIRFANERQALISSAVARLWLFKNIVSMEGVSFRRFYELPLVRNEHPALALSWTLYHVLDEESPLYGSMRMPLRSPAFRSRWRCPDTMSLQRKPSTPARPTIIPTFVLGTATPISSHFGRRPAQDRLRPVP